jgi:hypothetical protein
MDVLLVDGREKRAGRLTTRPASGFGNSRQWREFDHALAIKYDFL